MHCPIHFAKDVAQHFSSSLFLCLSLLFFALRIGAISATSDHFQRRGTLSLKSAPHVRVAVEQYEIVEL